jgi:hypothetical protein
MAAAAVAGSLLSPAGASAATEFGDTCAGTGVAPGEYTLTTLSAPPAALPLTAPSGGVITKLKMNVGAALPISLPTTVKVLRSAGGNSFLIVNQGSMNAGTGVTVADARLPVQAGDRLALHGEPFTYEGSPSPGLTFYCKETEGQLGAVAGNPPPGSTVEFAPVTTARVPVAAVIEPDADNDGFGDETQDKCPQSASTQAECPVIVLDSFALAKKSSIVVLVTTDETAAVTVSGTAKLPKGAKKASASAKAKLKNVKKNVPAGKLVRFTLKFPGKLKAALRSLPSGKSLTVKLQAKTTNVAGSVSKDTAKVKLKG